MLELVFEVHVIDPRLDCCVGLGFFSMISFAVSSTEPRSATMSNVDLSSRPHARVLVVVEAIVEATVAITTRPRSLQADRAGSSFSTRST